MRNALGLMVATIVSAALIAAVWFWTSSPRAELAAAPATVKAAQAERLPAAAKPADDVAVTAASGPGPLPPLATNDLPSSDQPPVSLLQRASRSDGGR